MIKEILRKEKQTNAWKNTFFIGTAAALAVLQPQTVPALVAGAGAAAIGGLISDIDVGTSQAHRDADKIITATVAVAVLTILAEYKLNLGIYRRLTSDSSVLRLLTGTAAFLLICAYGKQQPHRSFMHSFAALALLTACVDIIYPDASAYFAVGFLSHLVLDFSTGNRKAVLALEEGILPRILLSTGTCEPRTARVRHGISCCSTGALGACRAADG